MRKDLNAYYRALGLNPGAGPAQIRRAYRQLVRQWHPDLFKPGSPMQTTAEDITKEINEAYDQLFRKGLHSKFRPAAGSERESKNDTGDPEDGSAGARPSSTREDPRPSAKKRSSRRRTKVPPTKRPPRSSPPRPPWRGWKFLGAHWGKAAVAALLIVASVPPILIMREYASRQPVPAVHPLRPQAGVAVPQRAAGRPDVAAASAAVEKIPPQAPRRIVPSPEGRTLPARDFLDFNRIGTVAMQTPEAGRADSAARLDRAQSLLEVFEIGDTKAKVIAIQGAPDGAGDSVLRYGSSLVYFENGRVKNWSDGIPRLHVRAWPALSILSLDTFSLGSTREDVVRAQGEPAAFTPLDYAYGTSTVYFEDDRVAGWSEGDVSLRAFSMPSLPFIDLSQPAFR